MKKSKTNERIRIRDILADPLYTFPERYISFRGVDKPAVVFKHIDFRGFDLKDASLGGQSSTLFGLVERITGLKQNAFSRVVFENCLIDEIDLTDGSLPLNFDILQGRVEFLNLQGRGLGTRAGRLRVARASIEQISKSQAAKEVAYSLDFISCEIKNIQMTKVYFKSRVAFYRCTLGKSMRGESVNFNGAKFSASLRFGQSIFVKAPSFFDAEIHGDTDFGGVSFLDVSSTRAWRAYRTLKHHMMKFESDHEVQMFHALELESRYNTELPKGMKVVTDPKGIETIASFFMKWINDYGRNLWRPLIWLLVAACFFFILYLLFGQVGCTGSDKFTPKWVSSVCPMWTEVFYAARNAFGPFGLVLSADQIQPNTATVKILGFIHLLISSVIWFIWILQIRSRFKL